MTVAIAYALIILLIVAVIYIYITSTKSIKDLSPAIVEYSDAYKKLSAELADVQLKALTMSDIETRLSAVSSDTTTKLDALRRQLMSLVDDQSQKVANVQSTDATMQSALDAYSKDLTRLRASLQEHTDASDSKWSVVNTSVTDVQTKLSAVESSLQLLTQMLAPESELRIALSQNTSDIAKVHSDIDTLKASITADNVDIRAAIADSSSKLESTRLAIMDEIAKHVSIVSGRVDSLNVDALKEDVSKVIASVQALSSSSVSDNDTLSKRIEEYKQASLSAIDQAIAKASKTSTDETLAVRASLDAFVNSSSADMLRIQSAIQSQLDTQFGQINDIHKAIESVKAELATAMKHIGDYSGADTLSTDLSNVSTQLNALTKAVGVYTGERSIVNDLKQAVSSIGNWTSSSSVTDSVAELKTSLDALAATVGRIDTYTSVSVANDLSTASANIADLTSRANSADSKSTSMSTTIESMLTRMGNFSSASTIADDLSALGKRMDALSSSISKAATSTSASYSDLSVGLSDITSRLEALNAVVGAYNGSSSVSADVSMLMRKLRDYAGDSIGRDLDALSARITQVSNDLSGKVDTTSTAWTEKLTALADDVHKVQETVSVIGPYSGTTISDDLGQIRTTIASLTSSTKSDISEVNNALITLQQKLSAVGAKADLLGDYAGTSVSADLTALQASVSALSSALSDAVKSQRDATQMSMSQLESKLNQSITSLTSAQTQLQTQLTTDIGNSSANVDKMITQLQSQLTSLSDLLKSTQTSLEASDSEQSRALTEGLARLTQRLDAMQPLVSTLSGYTGTSVASDLDSLRQRIIQLEGQDSVSASDLTKIAASVSAIGVRMDALVTARDVSDKQTSDTLKSLSLDIDNIKQQAVQAATALQTSADTQAAALSAKWEEVQTLVSGVVTESTTKINSIHQLVTQGDTALSTAVDSVKAVVGVMRNDVDTLSAQMRDGIVRVDALVTTLSQVNKDIQSVQQRVFQVEANGSALSTRVDSLSAGLDSLSSRMETMGAAQTNAVYFALDDLRTSLNTSTSANADAIKTLALDVTDRLTQSAAGVDTRFADVASKLTSLTDMTTSGAAKLDAVSARVDTLAQQLVALETLKSVTSDIASLRDTLSTLNGKSISMENGLAQLRAFVGEYANGSSNIAQDLIDLKQRIEAQASVSASKQELAAVSTQLTSEANRLGALIASTSSAIAAVDNRVTGFGTDLNDWKTKMGNYAGSSIADDLTKLAASLEVSSTALTKLNGYVDTVVADKLGKIDTLQATVGSYTGTTDLSTELAAVVTNVSALKTQIDALQSTGSGDMKASLDSTIANVNSLKTQVDALQALGIADIKTLLNSTVTTLSTVKKYVGTYYGTSSISSDLMMASEDMRTVMSRLDTIGVSLAALTSTSSTGITTANTGIDLLKTRMTAAETAINALKAASSGGSAVTSTTSAANFTSGVYYKTSIKIANGNITELSAPVYTVTPSAYTSVSYSNFMQLMSQAAVSDITTYIATPSTVTAIAGPSAGTYQRGSVVGPILAHTKYGSMVKATPTDIFSIILPTTGIFLSPNTTSSFSYYANSMIAMESYPIVVELINSLRYATITLWKNAEFELSFAFVALKTTSTATSTANLPTTANTSYYGDALAFNTVGDFSARGIIVPTAVPSSSLIKMTSINTNQVPAYTINPSTTSTVFTRITCPPNTYMSGITAALGKMAPLCSPFAVQYASLY